MSQEWAVEEVAGTGKQASTGVEKTKLADKLDLILSCDGTCHCRLRPLLARYLTLSFNVLLLFVALWKQ